MNELEFLFDVEIPLVYRIAYLQLPDDDKKKVLEMAEKEYGSKDRRQDHRKTVIHSQS